jgi:hypothetical protein
MKLTTDSTIIQTREINQSAASEADKMIAEILEAKLSEKPGACCSNCIAGG